MFKKFFIKLKIKRAEKKLDHLLELRDLNFDYEDIKKEIKETIAELNNLDDTEFVNKIKKKHEKSNYDKSIFKRCSKCDKLILHSEKHRCTF